MPRLERDDAARLRARFRAALARWPTVAACAREIDVPSGRLLSFLHGMSPPRDVAERIARGCGVELDEATAPGGPRDFGGALDPGVTVDVASLERVPARTFVGRAIAPSDVLPVRPTRFLVASVIEPFALLEVVPPGLTLRDVQRAEIVYRQARAIPQGAATRQWIRANGRIHRSHEDDDGAS